MRTISGYRVVSNHSVHDLTVSVGSLINEGWEPFGSLLYARGMFNQVMVRYV